MFLVQISTIPAIVFLKVLSYFNNSTRYLVSLTQTLLPYDTSYNRNILPLFHVQTKAQVVVTILVWSASVNAHNFGKLPIYYVFPLVKYIFLKNKIRLDRLAQQKDIVTRYSPSIFLSVAHDVDLWRHFSLFPWHQLILSQ